MDSTNFIPWLMLASMLAFILIVPLLSNEMPDYEPARVRRKTRRRP